MKKGLLIFILALLILMAATTAVSAQLRKIRVVYTDWFPYTYQHNHQATGFEIEILKAVLASMGIQAVFVSYPWKRCLDELEKGRADALVSMLKTPEREIYTCFPEANISLSKTILFTTTNRDLRFDGSYKNLSGLRIGVIMGFSYGPDFDSVKFLIKDEAYDVDMLIRKLLGGRTDLAAENQVVIKASAQKMGVREKIRFLEPPIHTQKLYVGFSKAKGLEMLCVDFSKALGEFKQSEKYKVMIEQFGVSHDDMVE